MIVIQGREYGTAAEIAAALGPDITPAMVRRWADRNHLPRIRTVDDHGRPQIRYPLDEAAVVERDKRQSTRGRRRQLDETPTMA